MRIHFFRSIIIIISFSISVVFSQQEYGGIGALLNRDISSYIRVKDIAPGGPSEIAGIQINDLIFYVEDKLVSRYPLSEIIQDLRGEVGTEVKVKVFRSDKILEIAITRDKVIPWRQTEILEGNGKNGFTKMKHYSGRITEGQVKNGKFIGDIIQTKMNGEKHYIKVEEDGSIKEPVTIIYPDNRKYVGITREGVPHFTGTMTYPDGTSRSGSWVLGQFTHGCYSGNCENGYGVKYFSDGKQYSGTFIDGKANGFGTMTFSWSSKKITRITGHWENGFPLSPAQIYYENGDRYEGEFICFSFEESGYFEIGSKEGRGKQQYANGEIYEGNWYENNWHGAGTLIKKNGDRYVGSFEEGKMHGWIVARVNGKLSMHVYEQGNIDLSKQQAADEWFVENRPWEGTDLLLQQYALASPMFDEGCMIGDCENGIGILYYGYFHYPRYDDQKYVYYGPHKNGKPEGYGEMFSYFLDKKTFKGPFKDGLMHGMIKARNSDFIDLDRIYYKGKERIGYSSVEEVEAAEEAIRLQVEQQIERINWNESYVTKDGTTESWRKSDYDVCVSGDCENESSIIQFGNGDYYQGEMKNGMYHGEGRLKIYSTGYEFYGHFENGKLNGEGTMIDTYGNSLIGVWKDDLPISGSGYNADGCKVYDGIFRGGYLVGTTFRSDEYDFHTGARAEEQTYHYSSSSSGRSRYTQETIYYNKGTKDQWSVRIPVRRR